MSEELLEEGIIISSAYGEIPVQLNQMYIFEQGIIGFPDDKKYALLPLEDSDLFILHSCVDKNMSFIIIPASKVDRELSFEIDVETVELLEVQSPNDVAAFLIVHITNNQLYINAKAPILLVPSTRKGCQFVIHDPTYSVREPLVIKEDTAC